MALSSSPTIRHLLFAVATVQSSFLEARISKLVLIFRRYWEWEKEGRKGKYFKEAEVFNYSNLGNFVRYLPPKVDI
jgi:hypothetical protein